MKIIRVVDVLGAEITRSPVHTLNGMPKMKRDLSVHFPIVKRGILKNRLNKQPRLEKSLKCSKNEVEVKVVGR